MVGQPTTMPALLLAWILLASPPTARDVAKKLVAAFGQETGRPDIQAPITRQGYVGFETETIRFSIGPRVYRIVFASDGSVSVSTAAEGDLAAQPIWTGKAKETSADEIVGLVFSREFGRKYDGAAGPARTATPDADAEAGRSSFKDAASALRWNALMNRVLGGDPLGGASAGDGNALSKEASMARMMEPCSSNQGGASPQKAAMTEIATAMATAAAAAGDLAAETDRSRKYKKEKDYSFTKELEGHEGAASEGEAFRLIRQSRVATYDLFYEAQRGGDRGPITDPYAVAAKHNFRTVGRALSDKRVKALIDRAIEKIVVDVDRFTELQAMVGNVPVVYDRAAGKHFVDPTLRTPGEARYVLSLAVLCEWQIDRPEVRDRIARYEEKRERIAELEYAVLNEADARTLTALRAEADALALQLYETSENIWKLAARPAL